MAGDHQDLHSPKQQSRAEIALGLKGHGYQDVGDGSSIQGFKTMGWTDSQLIPTTLINADETPRLDKSAW